VVCTQILLESAKGRQRLSSWPQYAGSLVGAGADRQTVQVHLDVFKYFMFWFAFYALRGGQGAAEGGTTRSRYGYVGTLGPSLRGTVRKVKRWRQCLKH
jgi:hypothetical protein